MALQLSNLFLQLRTGPTFLQRVAKKGAGVLGGPGGDRQAKAGPPAPPREGVLLKARTGSLSQVAATPFPARQVPNSLLLLQARPGESTGVRGAQAGGALLGAETSETCGAERGPASTSGQSVRVRLGDLGAHYSS